VNIKRSIVHVVGEEGVARPYKKLGRCARKKPVPGSAAAGGVGVRLKQTRLGGGRLRRLWGWAGGGDVFLLGAHLEPEVAEAALQNGVGAVVEGRTQTRSAAHSSLEPFFLARLPGFLHALGNHLQAATATQPRAARLHLLRR
jgi:hypothetical protein